MDRPKRKLLRRGSSNVPLNPERLAELPALHPDRIGAMLPSRQEEARSAQELADIADTTKRAGAGGVISGQVGIRPMGLGAASKFLNDYTETGKTAKREKPVIDPHQVKGEKPYEGPRFKVISLPQDFCVMCARHHINPLRATPHFHPILEAWDRGGLVPGDVVRGAICTACWRQMKEDASSPLKVMVMGQQVDASIVKQAENFAKMDKIIKYVLGNATLTPLSTGGGFEAEIGS